MFEVLLLLEIDIIKGSGFRVCQLNWLDREKYVC